MQKPTGRLGFAFPPVEFACVHVKQITRHEIHVSCMEVFYAFKFLHFLVCESFSLYNFPRIHTIVPR